MKIPKIAMAGLLALTTVTAARASTNYIYITGSTAFRASLYEALQNVLDPASATAGFVGSAGKLSKATSAIISGTTISGSLPVTFETYFTGSAGGVAAVANSLVFANAYLTNTTPTALLTANLGGGQAESSGTYDSPGDVPTFTMCDVWQTSTGFPSTPALSDTIVGIVPFKWVRNAGSPSYWTNVTPGLAQALFSTGFLPLSLFTSTNADSNTLVYAIGRDSDSGTRISAFAESGFGASSLPTQWYPTNAGGIINAANSTGTIQGQEPVPAETLYSGVQLDVGQGGYSGGSDLAAAMTNAGSLSAIHGYYLTYLGTSDAGTAESGGAAEINWNGVPYSTNAIAQGLYTFWGYEHLDHLTTLSGDGLTIANLVKTNIVNQAATNAGLLLSIMNISRQTDGGVINNNFNVTPTY